jgi:hypothetical protein
MPFDQTNAALPLIGRAAEITPASLNRENLTIEIVWTTGSTVQRYRWEGWDDLVDYDEELAVTPEAIRLERMNAGAPFLNSHHAYDLECVLGSIVPGSVKIEGGLGRAQVKLTSAEDAAGIVHRILEGTVRFVSVGYRVHKYEITKEDGQREIWRAVDWEPMEVSAVAMPADAGAHIRSGAEPARVQTHQCVIVRSTATAAPAAHSRGTEMPEQQAPAGGAAPANIVTEQRTASVQPPAPFAAEVLAAERQRANDVADICQRHGMTREFETDLNRRGLTVEEARAAVLQQLEVRGAGRVATPVPAQILRDERDTMREGMEMALTAQIQRTEPATDQARSYMSMSMAEMAAALLGETRSLRTPSDRLQVFQRAATHSTGDFPAIFENALNRSLLARYRQAVPTYRNIAREVSFNDFRPHPMVRSGDFPELQPIAEGGEIKFGTFGEGRESVAVQSHAVGVRISRQMLINDDLQGIAQVVSDQGLSVARYEDKLFYAMLLSGSGAGPTLLSTTRGVFNTTDQSLAAAAAAITVASLSIARAALRKRTSIDGAPLELTPAVLLVGPDKETEAQQIVAPLQAAQTGNINPFAGTLRVVTSARITGNSWYLFADPTELPNFVYGFLNGASGPRMRTEEPFGTQGVSMTLEHDFGVGAIDFRGGFRNAGA